MNKLPLKVDPELRYVLPSGFEVTQDPVNRFHALGWMAVVYFASDDGFAAGEDAVWAFGEEGYAIVGIDEGEIERQRAEDST